jgi:1-acyl-sn-glycerol-3-phosphate acyltransferase
LNRLLRPLELALFYFRLFLMLIWMMLSSLIAMPLAFFRWKNAENNYHFARLYGPIARWIMGLRVVIEGEEYLRTRPAIYVVNHQSGLDMANLTAVFPRGAVVIGKKELRRIPVFGILFEAFGNVLIDRKDRANALSGLNAAVEAMKVRNLSAWIFPEGTRNASGEGLLPFKKGAFYMAVQAGVPIVPIVCSRVCHLVSFEEKYSRSGTILIRVLPPIPTGGVRANQIDALLQSTRETMLVALRDVSARAQELDRTRRIAR